MKAITSKNPKEKASEALKRLFKKYRNVPMLFLSSGGSALSLVQSFSLPKMRDLTVSVLDEHYVDDTCERNFEKLRETGFLKEFREITPPSIPPLPPPRLADSAPLLRQEGRRGEGNVAFNYYGGDVETAGKRLDAFLRNWIRENPKGKIVATVGMGADGHTAGIMPFADAKTFQKLFDMENTLAVGYKTSYGVCPERVTVTFSLLKRCDDVILYAVGEDKKETIRTLLTKDKPLHEFPAMFLKTLPQVTLFTDVK